MTVVAHLSDPHIGATAASVDRLNRVLAEVGRLPRLDALLITGDLADHGLPDEYAAFFAALPPAVPTLVTPGNHDVRDALRPFVPAAGAGPVNSVLDVADLRLVGLDTSVPGRDEGYLDPATLAFARNAIDQAPGRVLLAMHHPSIPVGNPVLDGMALINASALAELVTSSPSVIGCLTGHVHSGLAGTFAGRPMLGAVGIVSTLRIDGGTDPLEDRTAMPGLALHTIDDSGGIITVFHALAPGTT
ncbi:metallophosphoesterase [Cellulomonas fengjieae]|uniref:metallophosphoesterase n=1 Tax=Cellulomonas fengjieae TaxID=2819978 RepID=UPI001AAE4C57|nr:metallophosphoesterase [Cellulomonas fengjieae]MBO3103980.1 metallophosphoesterase [Cellulomonas fengjieae]